MLDRFESQVLRAAIGDLTTRVAPALDDAATQAALGMITRLLAHVVVRGATPAVRDIASEVHALKTQEASEDALLAKAAQPAGAVVSVETLGPYVAQRVPGARVVAIRASLGGFSKRTIVLELDGAPQFDNALVIRCDQVGGPVEGLAADELPILKLMHAQGLPVAEPLWADRDFVLGGTALCTRRVSGSSAFDLSGAKLGPQGPVAARELARLLAKVHAVSPKLLPETAAQADTPLRTHVERMVLAYQDQWQRHRRGDSPVLSAAFEYLLKNIPQSTASPTIVHGDASLRNLLIDDGKASGLLDWEIWHLGDPNEDLAYCRADVEQAIPWADFLAAYRQHGGVAEFTDAAGAYYGLFGAIRNAVFGATIIDGFEQAGQPGTTSAFAALYLARKLIAEVGGQLTRAQGAA